MKFTIEREVLIHLITQACGPMRGKNGQKVWLHLFACAARVFASGPRAIAGYEALVFADGQCQVRAWMFLEVLKSYAPKLNLTIEADEHGLRLERSTLPITAYSPHATPPAKFQVFPVSDLGVLGRG